MNTDQTSSNKQQQLKKHKRLATGLFLLMVAVYILITWWQRTIPYGWMGYVKAFAEAAMVGALADWFAVTALFHHPLGIPIPHTNLIEKSKKNIGNNLGNFVVSNFLTPGNIRPYITRLTIAAHVGTWLERPRNKELVISNLVHLLQDIIRKMDDKTLSLFIARKGTELLNQVKLNQIAANTLHYFLERGEQEKLITLLAEKIKMYISQNESMVQEKVRDESYFFVPKFVDQKLASKITSGLIKYFEEIELDKNHKLRAEITNQLFRVAEDMREGSKWKAEFDKMKADLWSEESSNKYAADIWQTIKKNLTEELADQNSGLVKYFSKMVDELTSSLKEDKELGLRIDQWIRLTAYKYILRNAEGAGLLISNTVGNWQGRELSQKLELEVGKDLQFIRINGTLVGGLVGLLIYTLTHLLG